MAATIGKIAEQFSARSVKGGSARFAMKTRRKRARAAASLLECDLTKLELRIAKRADKLWQSAGYCRGRDLILWLQAESEVLNRYFGLEQTLAADQ